MKRILIIGYGNLLREDDGVGRLAAEQLAELLHGPGVTVIPCHQLNPELVEPIGQADCVMFIDAAAHGIPGVMSLVRVRPAEAAPESFSHRIDPSMLLAASRSLYGRAPEALALTISGERFEFGETLSPVVAEVLPIAVDKIRVMVETECRNQDLMDKESAGDAGNTIKGGGSSAPAGAAPHVFVHRPRSAAN